MYIFCSFVGPASICECDYLRHIFFFKAHKFIVNMSWIFCFKLEKKYTDIHYNEYKGKNKGH